MPLHRLGGRSSRAATTAAAARLWRVAVVVSCVGCVSQRGNDVHAFAFAPPSSVHPASSASSSSSSASLSRQAGGLAGAASSSSSSSVPRLASRGVLRRQQQQQQQQRGCSSAVARTTTLATSSVVSPLRAAAGDDDGTREDWGREEGSGISGGSGAAGEGEREQPGLAVPDIVNPFKLAFEAGQNLRSTLATTLEQITGSASPLEGVKIRSLEEYEKRLYSPFDTEEEVPTVLVVGATGEMGRVVVRKLLLRGFSVRVLVRNLYSSTLDLLGTGATFAQGDLTNYRSIVDAVSGVDKVIFCAQARDPSQAEKVEFEGLRNLLAAFQDQRVVLYGDPYSTKKTLFRFNRPADRDLWVVDEASQASAMWKTNKFGYGTFGSTRMYDSGYATVESQKIKLNLAGFSGLAIRCCGDGKAYRFILRDKQYETSGIQFETIVQTKPNKWQTHRLSFSSFDAYLNGQVVQAEAGMEFDRASVEQLAIGYKREPVDPFNFILSMHFVKVYRTQIEPEFIYVSSAGVPPITDSNYDRILETLKVNNPKCYYNARGEELLRKSGLTYTIIRVEGFNNLPGGIQAIEIKQDPENVSLVSRADAAEITVQCLLDPRACNLALYTTTARQAPSAVDPVQKMSTQLSRLRPNT